MGIWDQAGEGAAQAGLEMIGLLWGKESRGVLRVEELHISRHRKRTKMYSTTGDGELQEAVAWGIGMGEGWQHVYTHTRGAYRCCRHRMCAPSTPSNMS